MKNKKLAYVDPKLEVWENEEDVITASVAWGSDFDDTASWKDTWFN